MQRDGYKWRGDMQPRPGRGWDQCTAFAMVKMVMGIRMISRMKMIMMMMMIPEAQKPKTFRVATICAQKLSGQSVRNRFSRQA